MADLINRVRLGEIDDYRQIVPNDQTKPAVVYMTLKQVLCSREQSSYYVFSREANKKLKDTNDNMRNVVGVQEFIMSPRLAVRGDQTLTVSR